MEISQEKYKELSNRIDAGDFLYHPTAGATPDKVSLPSTGQNTDDDTVNFREQCQQTLDLYLAKIKALEAQLESERKKQESNEALGKANTQTVDFNSLLEDKYAKLLKKSEEEARSNKKAIKSLQELSDKVLEENKKLKEENDRLQADFDSQVEEIVTDQPSQADWEAQWEAHKEMEEWETNSTSKSVKEVVKFCVDYVSNIDEVSDSHVEPIKDMMEDLLESPLAELLVVSDKLELTKDLHAIKKNRKQQINARNKENKKKEEYNTTNNFYAPIGQQVNSANNVNSDNQTKS